MSKEVWKVQWDSHLNSYSRFDEILDLKEDLFLMRILFSSREKAEEYVETYFNMIAEVILKNLIEGDEDDGEESEWNNRKAKKVQWDNVDQEFIDRHEYYSEDMRATTYWIEPEHAFDHYRVGIAYISCLKVR